MARMHARKKGKSGSTKPFKTKSPSWVPLDAAEIEDAIVRLKQEGLSTSEVGTRLRDQYGVPSVKMATGKSVLQHMKENDLAPEIPEDLANLMKKAINVDEHLQTNRKDIHNRRAKELIEAKIRRLVRYYQKTKVLPDDWKYSIKTAKLLVE